MIPVSLQPNGQGGAYSQPTTSPTSTQYTAAYGGTPKTTSQVKPATTFAGMQQEGLARPSADMVTQNALSQQIAMMQQQGAQVYQPNMYSALNAAQQTVDNATAGRTMGLFQYGGAVNQLGGPLMQQVMALLSDPTQGLNEAAQSNFDRQNRVLGQQFGDLRGNLNENMAARGLDASTIAATKLGDLGARQAEAQADLAARIQEKLINDRAAAMSNAINAAMGLRGQEAGMEKDLYTINRETGEMEFRRGLDTRKLDQDAAQFAQRLGLDAELGRGNMAINQGQLALANQRLGYDMNRDSRDFNYLQSRDSANDLFRNNEFLYRQGIDTRNFDYQTNRDAIGDRQWQSQFDYRSGRDAIGDQQWLDQFNRAGDWRTQDNTYRDSRDTIADTRYTNALATDQQRYTDSWNRASEWRTQDQQTAAETQRLNTILSVLGGMGYGGMSNEQLAPLFKSLGLDPSLFTQSSSSSYNPYNRDTGYYGYGTYSPYSPDNTYKF